MDGTKELEHIFHIYFKIAKPEFATPPWAHVCMGKIVL